MSATQDGPCAFPQPNTIQESVADPLAALGWMTISVSAVLFLIFITTSTGNRWVDTIHIMLYKTVYKEK